MRGYFLIVDPNEIDRLPSFSVKIICLTAAAKIKIERLGISEYKIPELGREEYGEIVLGSERLVKIFDEEIDGNLPDSIKLMGRQVVWNISQIIRRISYSIDSGPWYFWGEAEGDWICGENKLNTIKKLLLTFINKSDSYRLNSNAPPFLRLFNWVQFFILRIKLSRRLAVIITSRKLKNNLEKYLINQNLLVIKPILTSGFLVDWRIMVQNIFQKQMRLFISPRSCRLEDIVKLNESIARIKNRALLLEEKVVCEVAAKVIVDNLNVMFGVLHTVTGILNEHKRTVAVSYEVNNWISAAAFEAFKKSNRSRFVINHNVHNLTNNFYSDKIVKFLFQQRVANDLSDYIVMWACGDYKNALQMCGGSKIIFSREESQPKILNINTSAKFRIMYAGNWQDWGDYFAWVTQTSLEFLESIQKMCRIIKKYDEIQLTIRVRNKQELNVEILKQALNSELNIRVESSETDFVAEMQNYDLLISNFSTTIEQSLMLKKPILFWGNVDKYVQYQPSYSPPTAIHRSVVYASRNEAELDLMLPAIVREHLNKPLTDLELTNYVDSEEAVGYAELAKLIDNATDF